MGFAWVLMADEEESGNNFRGSSREAAFATSRAALTAVNAISALHEIGQKVKRAVSFKFSLVAICAFLLSFLELTHYFVL